MGYGWDRKESVVLEYNFEISKESLKIDSLAINKTVRSRIREKVSLPKLEKTINYG